MAGKKGRSGRPKNHSVVKFVKLTLDPVEDADLIAFFAAIPHGLAARAVKEALRGGMARGQEIAASREDGHAADSLDAMLSPWQ